MFCVIEFLLLMINFDGRVKGFIENNGNEVVMGYLVLYGKCLYIVLDSMRFCYY